MTRSNWSAPVAVAAAALVVAAVGCGRGAATPTAEELAGTEQVVLAVSGMT